MRFESFDTVHNRHRKHFFVAHPSHAHRPCPLEAMFFLLMCTTGLVEIVNIAGITDTDARHTQGMCSIEL